MNGILLIDKPQGWTSHDVIAKLRGLLREKRIGHSGTLDPMATGLLVVFVGKATKAVEFAEADRKEYLAALRPGIETDTQDVTGSILNEAEPAFSESAFADVLQKFTGEQLQVPPMYSAIKVDGRKLYELARRGQTVERKPRQVTIFALVETGRSAEGDRLLRVCCSKGTYIRTLCHDIGQTLGCGAALSALRRTRAGVFSVDEAHTLEDVAACCEAGTAQSLLLPTDSLFSDYPELTADEETAKRIRWGQTVPMTAGDGIYRVYSTEREFLMLGKTDNGLLSSIKNFFEVN